MRHTYKESQYTKHDLYIYLPFKCARKFISLEYPVRTVSGHFQLYYKIKCIMYTIGVFQLS